jgi:hypothetical protein
MKMFAYLFLTKKYKITEIRINKPSIFVVELAKIPIPKKRYFCALDKIFCKEMFE